MQTNLNDSAINEDTIHLTKDQDLEIRNRCSYYCDIFLRQYALKIDRIIDFIEKQEEKESLKSVEIIDIKEGDKK